MNQEINGKDDRMTVRDDMPKFDDFVAFVQHPENEGRLFEFINGEIIEVSPGRTLISEYRDIIAFAVRLFCRENNIPCHTSGEAGAYRIGDNTVVPDFAYKPTRMSDQYPDPVPPLWVVEVISPTDKAPEIRNKRNIYIDAGILLWELYDDTRSIDVYEPGKPKRTLGINDVLDGGNVLPDFRLPVREIFGED
jgi:Uma2 family endonuclease